jgi:hypothetical protein
MANKDMTVKRLIAQLKGYPSDALIVLASDSEGNSFHKLTDFGMAGLGAVTIDKRGVFENVEVFNPDEAPKNAKQALIIHPD